MNPYEVLGVSPNDDEETIKKAYRALVKKYHPDRYANTPLADEANEKLKEINRAYDIITGGSNTSGSSGGGYKSSYSGGYSGDDASFQNVRTLITMRMFDAADSMLARLPQTAEWYFLKGLICMNRGWYQKGREYVHKACSMDPANEEYRAVFNQFTNSTTSYKTYHTNIGPCAGWAAGICCLNICCNSLCRGCYCCC